MCVSSSLCINSFDQGLHLLAHVEKARPGRRTPGQGKEPSLIDGICKKALWIKDNTTGQESEATVATRNVTILSKVFPRFQNTLFLPVKTDVWSLYTRPRHECLKLKGEKRAYAPQINWTSKNVRRNTCLHLLLAHHGRGGVVSMGMNMGLTGSRENPAGRWR